MRGYSLLAPGPLCLRFLAPTGGVGCHLKGLFRYVRLDAPAACRASVWCCVCYASDVVCLLCLKLIS